MTPEPGSAPPDQRQAPGTTITAADAARARRWNRREREHAAKRLMSQAFIEIRSLAYTAKDKEDPADTLERIRLLADACHKPPRHHRPSASAPRRHGPEARQRYLRLLLTHVSPEGRHLLRAIRPGERPSVAINGLTEFRCLAQMNDQAIIAFRPRLRSEDLAVIPHRLSPVRQLWLAASTPRRHGRDDYLWVRAHQSITPDCPLCKSPPAG